MEKQAYKISEVMEITGLSRKVVYRAIANGEIQVVRTGPKRILIPKWSIDKFLNKPE